MEGGRERRKHVRRDCVVPCELEAEGRKVSGTVRDVSMGGLSVQADIDLEQGTSVHVVVRPDRLHELRLDAIVWNNRAVKQRNSGRRMSRMGLVLADAPNDYPERMQVPTEEPAVAEEPESPAAEATRPATAKKRSPRPAPPTRTPKPAAAKPAPKSAPPRAEKKARPALPAPKRYRVRVTQRGGPRTRSIVVFAASEDEARDTALEETGKGWEILELEAD